MSSRVMICTEVVDNMYRVGAQFLSSSPLILKSVKIIVKIIGSSSMMEEAAAGLRLNEIQKQAQWCRQPKKRLVEIEYISHHQSEVS